MERKQLIACVMVIDRRVGVVRNGPVYAIIVYDPLKGTSERLSPIDDPHCRGIPVCCQCVAVSGKLVLIGGFHPSSSSLMNSVYIYDFETARWSRGADMPTPRSFFACSVCSSTGLVYVAGGHNGHHTPLAAAETYNVEEDKWEILPPMIQARGKGCQGVFMEGKFMVFSGHALDRSAQVFDPSAGMWSRWEDEGFGGELWRSGAVTAFSGDLYVFIKRRVMKYDREKHVWSVVAGHTHSHTPFLMCATQWRDWIFVSGSHYTSHHICYMFNPSTGHFKEFDDDDWGHCLCATTVEL